MDPQTEGHRPERERQEDRASGNAHRGGGGQRYFLAGAGGAMPLNMSTT